ncbi:type VI secretion protein, EvpB/VC_A0108 family/type VI secretion protein, VC_A0107 family [Cohaesibacter marisflavi]|uniref:Type VI secretion protein, EvpB/VC_A0108 family/type VI secretion protein, VC_A0107 family n=2 Tax=Cohaesibacter marisflavi TaxID=655353 RepID=A0A1I5KIT3_9HYPH|nr:type VI secretion protein, EvpB/VC_A0108 family/type VI secretion protein, VC_A0107 family [Cohaesibacter marisflavi]
MSKSGQKFVARNRAPRVQIEYDVELYGAEKKVQLPFVMGVMSDLSGKSDASLPSVADRKFLEIDIDNFDERMKALRPRAAFSVPNTLTGDGNLNIDLSFESMEDFSPAAIAKKVSPLNKLLEARTRLSHLATYMDGKTGAEDLIAKLIADPQALTAILASAGDSSATPQNHAEAIESLRQAASNTEMAAEEDTTGAALNSLRDIPSRDLQEKPDERHAAFESLLSSSAAPSMEEEDPTEAVFDALRSHQTEPEVDDDERDIAFNSLLAGRDEGESGEQQDLGLISDGEQDLDLLLADEDAPDADDTKASFSDLEADGDTTIESPSFDLDEAGSQDSELPLDGLFEEQDAEDDDQPDELEALLLDRDDDEEEESEDEPTITEPFGILSLDQPQDIDASRPKFRIALLGDFTGRANRGDLATGDDLANRKPIKLDVDNLDTIIARFATTLLLPLGKDGAGIEVKLNSLDDLHPDELYENVSIFEELSSLRQSVAAGTASSLSKLRDLTVEPIDIEHLPRTRAKGSSVPANRKLGDFQRLIGDEEGITVTATPAEDLINRVVAPYVKAAADPDQQSYLAAIDNALSGVMRAILHHPDFQAVESTWRSLDLLARRVETDASLEIVLYDVSAEEWAADLSAQDELSESGLFRMLAEEPRLDEAQGPLSAIFGLYSLEETPPHAELLARMAKISAWMKAPFVSAISPKFLEISKEDRHPATAKSWDAMRALPEAAYVGLASPRFLLRLPYGRKTEPVDPFDFEEFTLRSGLKGMLWANPVILSAILMAKTVSSMGKSMELGKIMSLDDMPVHTMNDQFGDQIALPCTERLLNTRTMADVVTRGFIPLLSVKGRNEVRQGSFQALSGSMLAGPWASITTPANATGDTTLSFSAALSKSDEDTEIENEDLASEISGTGDDDLGLDLDLTADDSDSDALTDDDADSNGDVDLDSLLAEFDDETDDTPSSDDDEDEDDLDAELAALLEGL